MASIELLNLVTTRLVQQKKEIDFQLRNVVESENIDDIVSVLRDYREIISDIQVWESIIDDITSSEQTETDDINN